MKILHRLTWFQWMLVGLLTLILVGTAGLASGYSAGVKEKSKNLAFSIAVDIQTQFELGVQDYAVGNYDLARQRFEYVIQQYPDYPGVVDMLTETLLRLSETGVPPTAMVVVYPTPTVTPPSPTPDTRAIDELFSQAQEDWRNQSWKALVQTILSLRDIDPLYRVGEVDRMLFLALHFSGMEKILNDGNLEGGLYDLALVEQFAPLDKQAMIYQDWARLYLLGVSFWGVFPDKSVYYFSQLASAAPYLRDLSGIYAVDRYRMALRQYGDQLASTGDWCLAVEQYDLAQSLSADQGLLPTVTYAEERCAFGEETPTQPEIEATATTNRTTSTPGPIPSATLQVTPSPTQTVNVTLTPTTENPPIPTPTITPTPTVATLEPTLEAPTVTPTPTPSSTTESVP
jgi:tetratricopeptide (TPR) repeat protein